VRKNLLAFAAAAGLLSGQAWSLDLSQAYGEALEQDSTIRSVRAATDARRERLPQARAHQVKDAWTKGSAPAYQRRRLAQSGRRSKSYRPR
jgi:hypothetical protein